jgi:hypothetical protein
MRLPTKQYVLKSNHIIFREKPEKGGIPDIANDELKGNKGNTHHFFQSTCYAYLVSM